MSLPRARAAFAAVALGLACACSEPDDSLAPLEGALDSILATVAGSAGDLQVKRAGQGVWEPASIGVPLSPGDWVRTGPRGWARIGFVSGGALELDEEAVLVVEALKPIERTRPELPDSAPLVAVRAGTVRSTLADGAGRERPLIVRSTDGAETQVSRRVEAGPAELRVAAIGEATEVSVARGAVNLVSGDKRDLVEHGAAAALGAAGPRRVSLLGAPDLEAPAAERRVQVGRLGLRWGAVPEAAGYRVQVAPAADFRALAHELDVLEPEAAVELAEPGVSWWRVQARDASGRRSTWSAARRLFAEREAPSDALLEPADEASYAYAGAPPRISFAWTPRPGARAYRLVVARTPDLRAAPVASEVVEGPPLQLSSLEPGRYFWGVFVQGRELEPLFLAPRRLTVKKVSGSSLVTPKRIRKWGE